MDNGVSKMEGWAVDQAAVNWGPVEHLLTINEVAERVRRPVATVRYWRVINFGPRSAKVGGRVLYRESDVEKWIQEQFDQDTHDTGSPAA